MSRIVRQIGFSQRVRIEWFEQTTNLILAGNDKTMISNALQELLKDKVSIGGQAKRGNREKTITILLKTWLTAPNELGTLRTEGLEHLKYLPLNEQLAIHWGMVMAVYPFWADVATQVGRLLRLQGTAAAAHVQRRIREQYGERETVSRAARRVVSSFLDWGVIQKGGIKGVYSPGSILAVTNPKLIAWLAEAFLHAHTNESVKLKDFLESPGLFPFKIKPVYAGDLAAVSSRLELIRHGLNEDLIMLRKKTKTPQ